MLENGADMRFVQAMLGYAQLSSRLRLAERRASNWAEFKWGLILKTGSLSTM
ncbi:hypothetical protein SAMN04487769_0102 [Burkholderia sp. b14]|nr:hypothetical protein SAMN04487769_0102 [Burkholderia sp. b14]